MKKFFLIVLVFSLCVLSSCTYNRTINLSNTPDKQDVNYTEQTEVKLPVK